jgi:hypothetical protein
MFKQLPDQIAEFSEFQSSTSTVSYPGSVPSALSLRNCYVFVMSREKEMKTSYINSLTGNILCADHTFKVAKVPFLDHSRIFKALFSVMNEFGQVIAFWMTQGTSLAEVTSALLSIKARYGNADKDGPLVFYTDNCCKDRAKYLSIFPSLKGGPGEHFQRVLLDPFHLMDRYHN